MNRILSFARYLVSKKPVSHFAGSGLDVRKGERALVAATNEQHPDVIEAFTTAIREGGGKVDVIIYDKGPIREWRAEDEVLIDPKLPYCWSLPLDVIDLANQYDVFIECGPGGPEYPEVEARYVRAPWVTSEILASSATIFPEEIYEAINLKTWELIRKANKVKLTDPEGTNLAFTFLDKYWEKLSFPQVEKTPYIPGHIMGFPFFPLPQSDARGVLAGTANHIAPCPRIETRVEDGRITEIREGGEYGKVLKDKFEEMKDVEYQNYLPGPGVNWLTGIAIGTQPKIVRPREDLFTRVHLLWERFRSGVIHLDIGPHAIVDKKETLFQFIREGKPLRHYHIHLYFPTYEIETKDGEKIKVIDHGHLTTLDDPEIREVAAKYGSPDRLLKEDWAPAIPGISTPGDYQEYARDPVSWIRTHPDIREGYPSF